jgi:hypothetical protein
MNTSMLVLLFWSERGFRTGKYGREDEDADSFLERTAKRSRSLGGNGGGVTTKGASTRAAAPDGNTWVNPSLDDATGLDGVTTERLVGFMLSDDCCWYLTNGEQKVQLLRNEGAQKNQDAVSTWFGDGNSEYCYRSTPDIKDVPGFRVPANSGTITGEGWQLMHEVNANPADPVLAEKVRAGKTWVNYGLSRNKGTKHTFCDKGIYKLYVGSKESLTTTARWTHDCANSKLLGTITMHTGKEKSDAIVRSDAEGSFSTITVTASRAAYKGEPGGVVFDPKT